MPWRLPVHALKARARRLRLLVPRFGRDKQGAATVEFAIVVVPFLALSVGLLELSVDYYLRAQLDHAVHKAGQKVRSGQVQLQQMSESEFKSELLCPQLNMIDCSSVLVNARVIETWRAWKNWSPFKVDPSNTAWCPGGAKDAVLVQVAYPAPAFSLIWSGDRSEADGVRYFMSATAFRNKPFGLPASPSPDC